MVSLEAMPRTEGACDECGERWDLRVWPDGKLQAVGTGGACSCGSLAFTRLG